MKHRFLASVRADLEETGDLYSPAGRVRGGVCYYGAGGRSPRKSLGPILPNSLWHLLLSGARVGCTDGGDADRVESRAGRTVSSVGKEGFVAAVLE